MGQIFFSETLKTEAGNKWYIGNTNRFLFNIYLPVIDNIWRTIDNETTIDYIGIRKFINTRQENRMFFRRADELAVFVNF